MAVRFGAMGLQSPEPKGETEIREIKKKPMKK